MLSWDIALSEAETGDYSACVVLLSRGEVFYVLEVLRGRFPFDVLKRKVMEVKQRYGSSTLLIEDSPISRGLIQSLREKSINVTVYKPDTDKRARVIAQSDLFAGGSVHFPRRAGWLRNSPQNYSLFPGATTTKSMRSPRALHGAVTDGARFLADASKGIIEAWPVASDGIFGRDRCRPGGKRRPRRPLPLLTRVPRRWPTSQCFAMHSTVAVSNPRLRLL